VFISKERARKGKNDGKSKFSLFGKGKNGKEKSFVVGAHIKTIFLVC